MHVIEVPRKTEFKNSRSTVGTSFVSIISSCMLLQERLNPKTWDWHQSSKKDWIQSLEINSGNLCHFNYIFMHVIKFPRKTEFKDSRLTVEINYIFMHVIKVLRKTEFKDSRLTVGTSFVLIISSCMLSKSQERLNSKTRDWQWEPLLF